MKLCLSHLSGTAAGPDRLADTPQPSPRPALVDEPQPLRDDLRRVTSELSHIDETNPVAVTAQRRFEGLVFGCSQCDQSDLVGCQPSLMKVAVPWRSSSSPQ